MIQAIPVEDGIRRVMEITDDAGFLGWAKNWLSGKDRSCESCATQGLRAESSEQDTSKPHPEAQARAWIAVAAKVVKVDFDAARTFAGLAVNWAEDERE